MNSNQRWQLQQRIDKIYNEKKAKLEKKYIKKGMEFNNANLWRLVRAGKVKLRKKIACSLNYSDPHKTEAELERFWDFSAYGDQPKPEYAPALKRLEKAKQTALDTIDFGKNSDVLKALDTFRNCKE